MRLGVGPLPAGTTWRHVFGLAISAGVGFTVALFVTSLSFDSVATTDAAKVGILSGSAIAGIVGFTTLRTSPAASTAAADGHEAAGTPVGGAVAPDLETAGAAVSASSA